MKAILTAGLLLAQAIPAFAADHLIVQQCRRFRPGEVIIPRGDTLTVTNNDQFIHQIFLNVQGFSFDTAEKSPGQNVTEAFTVAGTFQVRCHIHPKMLLTVHVN